MKDHIVIGLLFVLLFTVCYFACPKMVDNAVKQDEIRRWRQEQRR